MEGQVSQAEDSEVGGRQAVCWGALSDKLLWRREGSGPGCGMVAARMWSQKRPQLAQGAVKWGWTFRGALDWSKGTEL